MHLDSDLMNCFFVCEAAPANRSGWKSLVQMIMAQEDGTDRGVISPCDAAVCKSLVRITRAPSLIKDPEIRFCDVSVAFMNYHAGGGIVPVDPPEGLHANNDTVWLVQRGLNGPRDVSRAAARTRLHITA